MSLCSILKILLLLLNILFIVMPVVSDTPQTPVNIRTFIDINADPFFSESTYNMMGLSLSGTTLLGLQLSGFGLGMEINDTYFMLNGRNLTDQMNGYWNVFRGALNFSHVLTDNFTLQWGGGGSWVSGAFNYNLGELFTRNDE